MKKNFSNKEIVEHLNGFVVIADNEQRYNAKLIYAITKNANVFREAYKPYEQALNKIKEMYEDGTKERDEEIRKLQEERIEVELHTIPFSSVEQYNFTLQEMLILSDMITEPENVTEGSGQAE